MLEGIIPASKGTVPFSLTRKSGQSLLDEPYLLAAARYVELKAVRARLATAPSEYRWSSACAHIKRKDDCLVKVAPLLALAKNWGDDDFQKRLEKKLGRVLRRQKPGPKKAGRR